MYDQTGAAPGKWSRTKPSRRPNRLRPKMGEKTENSPLDEGCSTSLFGMIVETILIAERRQATLGEIYSYILQHYPSYTRTRKTWQNNVRHTLSIHDCFMKGSLAQKHSHYWYIRPALVDAFSKGDFAKSMWKSPRDRKRRRKKLDTHEVFPPDFSDFKPSSFSEFVSVASGRTTKQEYLMRDEGKECNLQMKTDFDHYHERQIHHPYLYPPVHRYNTDPYQVPHHYYDTYHPAAYPPSYHTPYDQNMSYAAYPYHMTDHVTCYGNQWAMANAAPPDDRE